MMIPPVLIIVLPMKMSLTVFLTNIYRMGCFKMILIQNWKNMAIFKPILLPKWQNMPFLSNHSSEILITMT